jgi:hypothetical protein
MQSSYQQKPKRGHFSDYEDELLDKQEKKKQKKPDYDTLRKSKRGEQK